MRAPAETPVAQAQERGTRSVRLRHAASNLRKKLISAERDPQALKRGGYFQRLTARVRLVPFPLFAGRVFLGQGKAWPHTSHF